MPCKHVAFYGAMAIHRVGPLKPCDQIVLIAVTSAHRGEALTTCEFGTVPLAEPEQCWSGNRGLNAQHVVEGGDLGFLTTQQKGDVFCVRVEVADQVIEGHPLNDGIHGNGGPIE